MGIMGVTHHFLIGFKASATRQNSSLHHRPLWNVFIFHHQHSCLSRNFKHLRHIFWAPITKKVSFKTFQDKK